MREPEQLTRAELVDVVRRIQLALYGEEYADEQGRPRVALDRDKVWDSETIEQVDEAMVSAGLSPDGPAERRRGPFEEDEP